MTPFTLGFVGIGPQRTASSWLHKVLSHHPDIAFPTDVKETMFFDERFGKGMGWYEAHFRTAASHKLRAEIAPTYFDHDEALQRLKTFCPDLKIIVNVRNPVERAFSLFRHHVAKGRVRDDFERAVAQMPRILSSGRYATFCPRWEDAFGPDRMLYLVQEDIASDPEEVLRRVLHFLQLEPIPLPLVGRAVFGAGTVPRSRTVARIVSTAATAIRSHRLHWLVEFGKQIGLKKVYTGGSAGQAMTEAQREALVKTFASDIAWLEQRLGRDFTQWRYDRSALEQPCPPICRA